MISLPLVGRVREGAQLFMTVLFALPDIIRTWALLYFAKRNIIKMIIGVVIAQYAVNLFFVLIIL